MGSNPAPVLKRKWNAKLPWHRRAEIYEMARAGCTLNLKELAVASGFSYKKVQMLGKREAFPWVLNRVRYDDFIRWAEPQPIKT